MPENSIFPFYIIINQLEVIKCLLCAQYCRAVEKYPQGYTEYAPPKGFYPYRDK